MTSDAAHAEATDPTTPPERLAELAQSNPELGAVIVTHPAVYTGLIEWIAEHGDTAGTAAARAALTPAPPAPPAVPPSDAPRRGIPKRALVTGGIGLGVVAAVVAGALILPTLLAPAGGSRDVQIVELLQEPTVGTWSIDSPYAAEADDESGLSLTTHELGQDLAVIGWELPASPSGETGRYSATLIDTRTGAQKWTVDLEGAVYNAVGGIGGDPVVLGVLDDLSESHLVAIGGNGQQLSDSGALGSVSLATISADVGQQPLPTMVNGDVLAWDEDVLVRLPAGDLGRPRWQLPRQPGDASIAGDRVVFGDRAFSLTTGEPVEWHGDADVIVLELAGRLLGSRTDGDVSAIVGLSTTGETLWSLAIPPQAVLSSADILVGGDPNTGELTGFSLADGSTLWVRDVGQAAFEGGTVQTAYGSDVVWMPDGFGGIAVVDARTGDELYRGDVAFWSLNVIGATPAVLYARNGGLAAWDPRTGRQLWELPSAGDGYDYVLLGGRLVARSDSGGAYEPALVGIG